LAASDNASFENALGQVHIWTMLLSVLMAGIGIYAAFAVYYWKKIDAEKIASAPILKYLYVTFVNKYWIDELYEFIFVGGTKALAAIYRWFDDVIIDGVVNGTAKWTVGLTQGVKETWEEERFGSVFYIIIFGAFSLFIGWEAATSFNLANAAIVFKVAGGVIGLGIAALAFFLFYIGVGGFDNKIVDGVVNLVAYLAGFSGLLVRRFQTGKIQTYLMLVLFGVMVFFLWFR
jgi:NADH:ubiquinone oxidoreductase subunit 5 (subunit L)/multisubunit Na+/H+ antiporter MnhA subunit